MKVICPSKDKCNNPDCPHYTPHMPIRFSGGLYCDETVNGCLMREAPCGIIGEDRAPAKLERELEMVGSY